MISIPKTVLVAGLGRFGLGVAEKLVELGHEVCGVDRDPNLVAKVQHLLTVAMVADLADAQAVQEVVGGNQYDVAVVAIGTDLESSLQAALHLKECGVPYIIAKALSETHGKLLRAIGVHRVVYPEREAGERIALEMGLRGLLGVITLGDDLQVVEVEAPKSWWDRTLAELALRQRYNLVVLCIKRGGGVVFPPGPDTRIQKEDQLLVLARPRSLRALLA